MAVENRNKALWEVAGVFLKLGVIGFGGPAAHIAMMEEEVVRKRNWFSQDHFLDLVGATNLIPGPNSTEMTMHCGHERVGWPGLIVAGLCFILPAVIITSVFAWAYAQYGTLPQVQPFIYGIKPAIIALIVSLMISLGRKAVKSVELGLLGSVGAILALCGVNEIYLLFGLGLIGILIHWIKLRKQSLPGFFPITIVKVSAIGAGASFAGVSSWSLFWIFLKIGSILYGSGYVLFAFLDTELVATGLLTKQQLIDAIAVGQFTPGPVFSSATFIGWQIGGLPGAMAATIGIFLPSFVFVAMLNPLIPRLRKSRIMSAFLDAVNVAAIGIILAVCVEMGNETITDWRSAFIAILSLAITLWFKKLNSALIVLGGALLGFLLTLL